MSSSITPTILHAAVTTTDGGDIATAVLGAPAWEIGTNSGRLRGMDPLSEPADAEPEAPAAPAALTAPLPLVRALDLAALALVGLVLLYELFVIGAGLAFQARQFPGDEMHRVGFVAASAIDLRVGVALALSALAAAAGVQLAGRREDPSTQAVGVLVLVAGALAVILSGLAVRAQYHQLALRRTAPTSAFHLGQAAYVVGSVGPALVACAVVAVAVLGGGSHR